jgi:hypothetical protein
MNILAWLANLWDKIKVGWRTLMWEFGFGEDKD